jgi:DNA-directed RNA polymerase alpha subunit
VGGTVFKIVHVNRDKQEVREGKGAEEDYERLTARVTEGTIRYTQRDELILKLSKAQSY